MTLQAAAPRTAEVLRQDPESMARDVRHLKEWIGKQPHLPRVDDDVFLERFLYGCKNRLSRCKEVLDMYYTVRGAVPEFFGNRDPSGEDIRLSAKTAFIVPLGCISSLGYRVTVQGILVDDPHQLDALAYLRRCFLVLDTNLKMEAWYGDIIVIDMSRVTWSHLSKFTPALLKKFFVCSLDAFPLSVKEIHFIYAPSFLDKFLAIIKPFLKEKLRNRIQAHEKGLECLRDRFPPEMLPDVYGGTAGTIAQLNDEWQKRMESLKDWFVAEEVKVSDESKRPNKTVGSGVLFGMDGSFRQLTID